VESYHSRSGWYPIGPGEAMNLQDTDDSTIFAPTEKGKVELKAG
jgi:hypothetical protein